MIDKILSAQRRQDTGKGPARRLRYGGKIPAVVYGHGREPQALTVDRTEFEKILSLSHGSTILELDIDGTKQRTLVRDIQRHPTKKTVTHVDFMELHAGERIRVDVPIELVGTPDGVRNAGGVMEQFLREIEVEILPKDIPELIKIDVTDMRIVSSMHVRDVTIENAKILTDPSVTICTVLPPRVEVEPVAEAVEAEEVAEPELIRKAKAEGEEEEADED
jgi:large subunit ribosomal protein L25